MKLSITDEVILGNCICLFHYCFQIDLHGDLQSNLMNFLNFYFFLSYLPIVISSFYIWISSLFSLTELVVCLFCQLFKLHTSIAFLFCFTNFWFYLYSFFSCDLFCYTLLEFFLFKLRIEFICFHLYWDSVLGCDFSFSYCFKCIS